MHGLLSILLLSFLVFLQISAVSCQNSNTLYKITLELKNILNGEKFFLQKYTGIKLVVVDSLVIDGNSEPKFSGNKQLEQGMYSLSYNKKLLANFFISNPNNLAFAISLDLKNPAQTLVFSGSPENQTFVDYLRFLNAQQQKGEQADLAIKQKGEQLQKQFPGSMLTLFIKSLSQTEIPEPTQPIANKQEYVYFYLANHFFDNIDFSDKRLLNTPILEQKLGVYFSQMVPPVADSATVRVSEVLAKTNANNDVYNWAVRYLYQLYRESPIPNNSEVYNFIGEQFILKEPQRWNDDAFVKKVRERVLKSKLNQVGTPSTNLKLQTPEGKTADLYSVAANKTILFFFNPGCEACHAVTEKLFKIYQQYKSRNIQVFAVYVDRNKYEWHNYISAKGLNWINVYDPTGQESIDQKYDIFAIPMIYLLDRDKKILAKDVPVIKLEKYLNK